MEDVRYNSDYLHELFGKYVPNSGKASNLLGELVRAWARITYRWYNDGDQIGYAYGRQTCNPAARFLAENVEDLAYLTEYTDNSVPSCEMDDETYEDILSEVTEVLETYIRENEESLLGMETADMFESGISEYDDTDIDYDEDEEEDYDSEEDGRYRDSDDDDESLW